MATIGKVSAVFTASTGGLTSGVKAAANSFRSLGGDAAALTSSLGKLKNFTFTSFQNAATVSAAASSAFQLLSSRVEFLRESLRSGAITTDAFKAAMDGLTERASVLSQVFSAGAATTARFATAQEVHAATTASLREQLGAGAITYETYSRAIAAANAELDRSTGVSAQAAAAAAELADARSRGEAIAARMLTSEERFAATTREVHDLMAAGAITIETHGRAIAAATSEYLRQSDAITETSTRLDSLIASLARVSAVAVPEGDNPFAGIAESFAAGVAASDSFVAATTAASGSLARVADASSAAGIAEQQRQEFMARGREIAASVASASQLHAEAIQELDTLYGAGAISAEIYNAAVARQDEILAAASGASAAQVNAMRSLADAHSRGAAVTRSNMTAQEKYQAEVADLSGLLRVGAINQQTYNRAVAAAASSMRQAGAAAGTMQAGLSGVSSRLNVLIGLNAAQLFGSITSTISQGIGSLVRFGAAQAEVIGRQKDLAAQLGMSYSQFAGIANIAAITGVGIESVAAAATKADVALVRAEGGSRQAQAAFAGLGLNVSQLAAMNPADRFSAIAQAIASIPDAAGRSAAAVALFGKSGAGLLPLFEDGAAGIAAARAEAERFGLALTTAQVSDVDQMGDSFARAQQAVAGVVQQVVAFLAPAVESVTTSFSNLIGSIGGANIGQAIGEGILQGARFLAGIGDFIIQNFGSTFEYLSQVGQQWGAVGDFFNRTANFLSGVFNAAQAGLGFVILGFTGAFEGLATIAQQIGQFLGFDTSTLDAVVAGAQAFNQEISNGITQNLTAAQEGFANAFATNAAPVGQAIAGPLTTALDGAIAQANASANAIDQASPAPIEIAQTVEIASINEALKGIDSRSQEGVSEMFRLMRGNGGDIQQQQLSVLEQIAENTAAGDDEYAFTLD